MKLLIYQNSWLDFERSYALQNFINSHSQVSDTGPKGPLVLFSYDKHLIVSLSDNNRVDVIETFNSPSICLDGLLKIDILYFQ